jgi:hypothetical protein
MTLAEFFWSFTPSQSANFFATRALSICNDTNQIQDLVIARELVRGT